MKAQSLPGARQAARSPFPRALMLALLGVTLLFGVAAASHESLWIDEGFSAYFANQPDFGSFWAAMKTEGGSDAQTPFYTAYLWGWRHGFGLSEYSMRLANLPWLLIGHAALLAAMLRAGLRRNTAVFFVAAAAVSPFLSFYVNQGRCYVMQYGTACLVLAYLVDIAAAPECAFRLRPLATGLLGAVLLCGTSLLAVAWAGAAGLAACWMLWKNRQRGARPTVAAAALLAAGAGALALLGAYYLGTLLRGARAVGGETNLGTLLFCGYEMAGLAGFGPGRNDLRHLGLEAARAYGPALAAAAAVIFGTLGWGGAVRVRKGLPLTPPVQALAFALLPLGFTFGMGAAVHFRVLARHVIAFFPLVLLLTATALSALFEARRKGLPLLFLAAWAASAGLLRFSSRHQREDYRGAAAAARADAYAGQGIWWVADRHTGAYYGLTFGPGQRVWMNPARDDLQAAPAPGEIFLSKPEIYDGTQTVRAYLAANGYSAAKTFPGFTVYAKRP